MAWQPSDLERFSEEVKFQVGQFVEIDIPEVPVSQRECTWGVIVGIRTRFPLTSKMRQIKYEIKLAGRYIKRECCRWKGLRGELVCGADYLTLKGE